ncbi:FAD-binding oxidoreductase [Nonomuraea sp. NPDC048916]|uniref:FAD-binding oxidoreductase n=1 Tax=Nonomuraea sp. NPDC048916 TaxID=3154232 RepID=UPI0033C37C9B
MTAHPTLGEVVRPGDEDYERLRRTFAHIGSPAYVVRCEDAARVARAIAFAREEGLPLSVRGGGHSGAGFGTNDGGLVIDLSPIDRVEVVGGPGHLVRIGAGARWGEVARTLAPHGLAVSSGDTSTVGVGGLMLGGGIGWLVRKHGLALDHLVAAEVVTADGRVVRADEKEHADLFWALRGGGGNFGVVTTFEVSARPQAEVTFARVAYPADTGAAAVLKGWRDVMREAGDDLTTIVHVLPAFGDGAPAMIMITACHAGDDPAAVAPLMKLGEVLSEEIATVPYAQVLEEPSELPPAWRPLVRNRFVPCFADELADAVAAAVGTIPMMLFELRALGGAMNRVPAGATAFAHRDSEIMLSTVVLGAPEDHEPLLGDFEALWRMLGPHTAGAYGNFLTRITPDDLAATYPAETYERLAAVKRVYDPGNLFRLNANVRP